jgi:hypothetical protein
MNDWYTSIQDYIIDWVADAGGAGPFDIAGLIDGSGSKLVGVIRQVETSPGTKGDKSTNLPSATYDVSILDELGAVIPVGTLTGRSITVAEAVLPAAGVIVPVASAATVTISSAAGSTKQGRVIVTVSGV